MGFQAGFEDAKILVQWYKQVFVVAGVWPLESSYLAFTYWTVYSFIQYILYIGQLLSVAPGIEMVMLIGELSWITMIIPKLIILRFSRKLVKLLLQILDEMDDNAFKTIEEKEIYLAYIQRAKDFAVVMGPLTIIGVMTHYGKPFAFLLKAVLVSNQTVPLITPFRTYMLFDVNDYYTLTAWWIYQIPMILVNAFHPAALGFVLFLVYHACGQLSALSSRIKNLGVVLTENPDCAGAVFRHIVEKHQTILQITKDINEVFTVLFLEELLMTTIMIILTCHTVIVSTDFSETANLVVYANYTIIMFLLIYGYCVAGEYLMLESANVYEAYYQCEWYDLPDSCKKPLMICMIGASNPVHLLGGGFYIFSLSSFAGVLKTAMSYVSLLRTLM